MTDSKAGKFKKLLNTKELAQLLGVRVSTIYGWVHYGFVPYIKLGRLVKFQQSKIAEWQNTMSHEARGVPAKNGIRKAERIKQTSGPRQHRRPTGREANMLNRIYIYKAKNKSGVKYGIRFPDPITGTEKKKIISSSKEETKKVYRKMLVEIDEGREPGTTRKPPLFQDFVSVYLQSCKNQDSRTHYEAKKRCLGKWANPFFNGLRLNKISIIDIEKFKNHRASSVGRATVNRDLAYLRHFFNKAIDYGYLKFNPTSKIKLFRELPGRVRYLQREEIALLLDNCAKEIKPIVIVALNTGMRRSEILRLEWQDVDFNNGVIIVQNSKNNEKRILPMNDAVMELLMGMKKPYSGDARIFQSKNLRHGFEKAVRDAKLKDFRFHDLRHTFASHLAMSGASLVTIKELMGHKSLQMTLRYSHLCNQHLEDAVKKLQITP